jgi:hypothetical protein
MATAHRSVTLGFGGESFPEGTHICYLYADDDELRRFAAGFVEAGLGADEKVYYFVARPSADEVAARLASLGVRASPGARADQLVAATAAEMYYPEGSFDPERMLALIASVHEAGIAEGYAGVRGTGEMAWALSGAPGAERLIEYEARVNTVVEQHPATVVCQYDARLFDGGTLFDVLAVHPMMVVRGQVVRNPYYVPPEQFLRRRRAAH